LTEPVPDWATAIPSADVHKNLATPDWTFPFTPQSLFQSAFELMEQFMRRVVEAIVGIFVPGPLGSAFNQLKNWADNILRQWIIEPLEALVELLIDIIDTVPFIGPPIGNAIEDLANIFGLLKDRSNSAQQTADKALQLLSGEDADISDDFERSGATNLGANWTQNYGSGNGSLGVKDGYAHWYPSGGGTRFCRAVNNTTLTSDNGSVRFVLSGALQNISSPPFVELIARSDSTTENCVIGRINRTSVEIGYILSGTYTQLNSESFSGDPKGVWELSFNNDDFVLSLNGSVKVSATDSGSVSQRGSSYRHVGFTMRAGNAVFLSVFVQQPVPDIAAWAASNA